MTKEVY